MNFIYFLAFHPDPALHWEWYLEVSHTTKCRKTMCVQQESTWVIKKALCTSVRETDGQRAVKQKHRRSMKPTESHLPPEDRCERRLEHTWTPGPNSPHPSPRDYRYSRKKSMIKIKTQNDKSVKTVLSWINSLSHTRARAPSKWTSWLTHVHLGLCVCECVLCTSHVKRRGHKLIFMW